jgi:hypothetical protein
VLRGRRACAAGLVAAASLGAAASATSAAAAPARGTAGTADYAGAVAGSNAYIGLSLEGGRLIAYLCDGDPAGRRAQTIGEWFRGRVDGGRVTLRSRAGARLIARVSPHRVAGRLRLADGRVLRFVAPRARGRVEFTIAARPLTRSGRLVAGWIRLPDGSERGTDPGALQNCAVLLGTAKEAIKEYQRLGLRDDLHTAQRFLARWAASCI